SLDFPLGTSQEVSKRISSPVRSSEEVSIVLLPDRQSVWLVPCRCDAQCKYHRLLPWPPPSAFRESGPGLHGQTASACIRPPSAVVPISFSDVQLAPLAGV